MAKAIVTPWEIKGDINYERLAKEFGVELLKELPKVKVNMDYFMEPGEEENTVSVFLENPSQTIAFGINLSLVKSLDGEEILPAYWDDNYFSLLPGESRTVKVRYKPIKSKNKDVDILLKGWNVL